MGHYLLFLGRNLQTFNVAKLSSRISLFGDRNRINITPNHILSDIIVFSTKSHFSPFFEFALLLYLEVWFGDFSWLVGLGFVCLFGFFPP